MDEFIWVSASDPRWMLAQLQSCGSDRKLRWFAVAACRLVAEFHRSAEPGRAIPTIEEFADGRARWADMERTRDRLAMLFEDIEVGAIRPMHQEQQAIQAVRDATHESSYDAALGALMSILEIEQRHTSRALSLCRILRDIFGNPFRPIAAAPDWNSATVASLAQTIYDERAFDRLPILADALEDAGCTNAEVLEHCRQPQEHVRGCWVVDLLLGKS